MTTTSRSDDVIGRFSVPTRAQGKTGIGQGGWTSARFEEVVGRPITVALRSPIPLETELTVIANGNDVWQLGVGEHGVGEHGVGEHGVDDTLAGDRLGSPRLGFREWRVVLEGRPAPREFATTPAVSIELATQARSRFRGYETEHPAPQCFSCGIHPESMCVHNGPLLDGTGRYASDWTPPAWVGGANGIVGAETIWAVLDCASGFYVGQDDDRPAGVTVQYEVEVLGDVRCGQPHAIVAWNGVHPDHWDGRKRGAASCLFEADGTLLAQTTSFWVAPSDPAT